MEHISNHTTNNQHISRNSQTPDQLSHSKIKRLFALLQANYGSRWVDQTGTGNALKLSMQVWAEKLADLSDIEIAYGLRNLPGKFPPTPTDFKDICRNKDSGLNHNTAAYKTFRKELPAPRDLALARKELDKSKRILKGGRDMGSAIA